ncbi:hypothetical protein ONZ43_g750 [Nemania bipapillata]|uniref:Uncharacterized protein n=1 Tax=Nemania bipapillata TaxID=110536 RepID=A0ACC2J742_9PEZI|nr:hypothetical protein ONZ43_g750 [Nemania bipapillata]
MSFGFGSSGDTGARAPSSENAAVICTIACALSMGVTGMSPQSRILAQFRYGLMLARGLKPRKVVCRAEAARIALGPKRAPARHTRGADNGNIEELARRSQALDMLEVSKR